MAFGGLVKDSVALYVIQRSVRGVKGVEAKRLPPDREREVTRELRAWYLRITGITALWNLLRMVGRAWWRAAQDDLRKRAEARLAASEQVASEVEA